MGVLRRAGPRRGLTHFAAIPAAGLVALLPAAAALAQTFVVVSRPHHHADDAGAAAPAGAPTGGGQNEQFRSTLNRVFGPGQWRQTSGYRSPAQEDELRREGAGTVPVGQLSHHSMGTPDAPGAYDVVVPGMSTEGAAEKLRSSGAPFARVFAEGAHGPEGSHLHIEPASGMVRVAAPEGVAAAGSGPAPDPGDSIYLRVIGGKRNPALVHHR